LRIAGGAGLALAYDPALVRSLRAAPVQGHYDPVDALRRALTGSGLELRASADGRTLTLAAVPIKAPPPRAAFGVVRAAPAPAAPPLASVSINARRDGAPDDADARRAPGALWRIDGEELERQQVTSLLELQQLVPALNIQSTDPSDTRISIRGLGDGGGQAGGESNIGMPGSVAVYLNNVYLARPGMLATDLDDLDRAEVLSGAQGTLFGANATGGVVDLHSREPGPVPEARASAAMGQNGYLRVKAMLSGPLGEDLAGRLNLVHAASAGTILNTHSGAWLGGGDADGLRGQLMYKPDARFKLRLSLDAAESHGAPTPLLLATHAVEGVDNYLLHAAQAGAAVTAGAGRTVDQDDTNRIDIRQGGVAAQATWIMNDGFTLRSVSSYRYFQYRPDLADNLPVPIYAHSGTAVLDRSWSQQLRLDSPDGGAVGYAVGVDYLGQDLATSAHQRYAGSLLPGLFYANTVYDGIDVVRYGSLHDAGVSPFIQGSWKAAAAVTVTGGLRLGYDRKDGRFVRLNKAAFDSGTLRATHWLPSALLNLEVALAPGASAYLAWSHGEKAGGINVSAGAANKAGNASLLVAPEQTHNLEAGVHAALDERRLSVKADLFQTDVLGFQTQGYDPGLQQTYLMNAGGFRSRGAEASLRYQHDGSGADAGFVFNDARYTDFADAPCPPEVTLAPSPPPSCNLTGRRVFNTPRLTFNAGLRHSWPTENGRELHAGARYAYRGWMYASVDDSAWTRQSGYGLLALSAGVSGPASGAGMAGGRWDATVWINNALDKTYYRRIVSGDYGSVFGWPGDPRTLGVTISYRY
jgi:iron complex outermembrane receptor protein